MVFLSKLKEYSTGHGAWSKPGETAYDRYHTAYCAAIGLMSFSFLPRGNEPGLKLPVPRAFQVRAR